MRRKAELKDLKLGPMPALVERKPLGEHVFDSLKQAIIRGRIASGQWLVESHIAEVLGISRTPVREAIHKLEREGFIARPPRGGFRVLGLKRQDVEETFGIRAVLESYAARLAAVKHRPEELEPLEKKIAEFQRQLDRGRLGMLPEINTQFHDLLYGLSKSPRLIQMINALRDQIFRFRQIMLKHEKLARTSNRDHRLMLKLIGKREADGVERLVREHILRGQELVLQHLDRQAQEEAGQS